MSNAYELINSVKELNLNKIEDYVKLTALQQKLNATKIVAPTDFKSVFPYGYRNEGKYCSVFVSSITYREGESPQIFMLIEKVELDRMISPSLTKLVGEIDIVNMAKVVQKYNLKSYENIFVSNRGKIFVGNKVVKPAKILRLLKPNIHDYEIENIVEELYYRSTDLSENIRISRVEDVYTSNKLKIQSCMTHGDSTKLQIYDALGVSCIYVIDKKENIIARTLCYEGKYISRVYAHSNRLAEEFTKTLKTMGYLGIPRGYATKTIQIEFGTLLPYMDKVNYINKTKEGGVYFSNNSSSLTIGIASSTDGGYSVY